MSIFAIADLHLSFCPDVDKSMSVFGGRWENYEDRLEKAWRHMVSEDDTVIIVGDISWGIKLEEAMFDLKWIHGLPGKKIMLKGNHDLWWNGITKLNGLFDDISFLQNDCFVVDRFVICGSRGWLTPDNDDFDEKDEKIYNREILRLEMSLKAGMKKLQEDEELEGILGFTHYPPVINAASRTGFQDLFEKYGVQRVYYGHIHGEDSFRAALQGDVNGVEYRLISADYLDCRPLEIVTN